MIVVVVDVGVVVVVVVVVVGRAVGNSVDNNSGKAVDPVTGDCGEAVVELDSFGSVVCMGSVINSSVFFSTIPSTLSSVVVMDVVTTFVVDGVVCGVDFAVDAINLRVEVDLVTGVVTSALKV